MLQTVTEDGSVRNMRRTGGTVHLFATAGTQAFAGRERPFQDMPVTLALGFGGQCRVVRVFCHMRSSSVSPIEYLALFIETCFYPRNGKNVSHFEDTHSLDD